MHSNLKDTIRNTTSRIRPTVPSSYDCLQLLVLHSQIVYDASQLIVLGVFSRPLTETLLMVGTQVIRLEGTGLLGEIEGRLDYDTLASQVRSKVEPAILSCVLPLPCRSATFSFLLANHWAAL